MVEALVVSIAITPSKYNSGLLLAKDPKVLPTIATHSSEGPMAICPKKSP